MQIKDHKFKFIILLLIVFVIISISIKETTTYKFYHKQTDKVTLKTFNDLNNEALKNSKYRDVVFIPKLTQVEAFNNGEKIENYQLNLHTYKYKDDETDIYIKSVTIEDVNETHFNPTVFKVNKKLFFGDSINDFKEDKSIIVRQISKGNIVPKANSLFKVTLQIQNNITDISKRQDSEQYQNVIFYFDTYSITKKTLT